MAYIPVILLVLLFVNCVILVFLIFLFVLFLSLFFFLLSVFVLYLCALSVQHCVLGLKMIYPGNIQCNISQKDCSMKKSLLKRLYRNKHQFQSVGYIGLFIPLFEQNIFGQDILSQILLYRKGYIQISVCIHKNVNTYRHTKKKGATILFYFFFLSFSRSK